MYFFRFTSISFVFALIGALVTAAPAAKEKPLDYSVQLSLIIVVDLSFSVEADGTLFAIRTYRGFI